MALLSAADPATVTVKGNVLDSACAFQIHAREELAETGHPEPPHSHGAIDFGASLGIAEKSLPTPDEVAGSETEKADRDGPK